MPIGLAPINERRRFRAAFILSLTLPIVFVTTDDMVVTNVGREGLLVVVDEGFIRIAWEAGRKGLFLVFGNGVVVVTE